MVDDLERSDGRGEKSKSAMSPRGTQRIHIRQRGRVCLLGLYHYPRAQSYAYAHVAGTKMEGDASKQAMGKREETTSCLVMVELSTLEIGEMFVSINCNH